MNLKKVLIIIPAAGQATRMQPLSATMSKAMIPVCGKPILTRIFAKIRNMNNIFAQIDTVVVGGDLPDIKNYLDKRNYNNIYYTQQDKQYDGPLGAIFSGLEYAKNNLYKSDEVLIWLGDTLIENNNNLLSTLFENKLNFPPKINLGVATVSDWSRWCMIDENFNQYDKHTEKPPTDKTLIGLYKFNLDSILIYN